MLLIQWANGETDRADDFGAALSVIQEQYPGAVAYDLGGISMQRDDGLFGRALVWKDEESRANDDGTDAVAAVLPEE